MEVAMLMLQVRNIIRVFDLEKTRDLFEDQKYFYFLTLSQMVGCFINTNYMLVFLRKTKRQAYIITPFLGMTLFAGCVVGIYGYEETPKFSSYIFVMLFMGIIIFQ